MLKLNPVYLSVAVLLIASQSCALPSVAGTPDPNFVGTMVAQTIIANITQTTGTVTSISNSETPSPTFTPLPPTDTPTPTVSPLPLFTSTPLTPQISVSVATNCRIGPGKIYDRVGALLVGDVAQIYGRNSDGTYWYIRNPNSATGFCWLWGEYATVSGNALALPIFTPPPSPTPTVTATPRPLFKASYVGMDSCVGWWVEIRLENISNTIFKSISLTVKDLNTNTVLSAATNGFTNIDGCVSSNTKDSLPIDGIRRISSPVFSYNPAGHKLQVSITLCSKLDLKGSCTSDVIEFKP